jgi:FkbM family methyltransferase
VQTHDTKEDQHPSLKGLNINVFQSSVVKFLKSFAESKVLTKFELNIITSFIIRLLSGQWNFSLESLFKQMNITANLFKILFKIPFFQKRYFGFYQRIFKPYRLFKGKSSICKFDGNLKIKADLEEWIQQQIYFFGIWDEQGIKFLKNSLKEGDVFFDIGANIGCYSLVAAKQTGPKGEVHSFEPVSKVFYKLQNNVSLNGFQNIKLNQNAVFEKSGILELFVSSNENGGMSSMFHHDTESGQIEKANAITIDEYVNTLNIQKIDFIKIDIEGAEIFALKGMKNTLRRFKPIILMELSDDILNTAQVDENEILSLLSDLNYEMRGIDQNGNLLLETERHENYSNYAFCQPAK